MPFLRKYNTLTVTGTTAIRVPMIKRGVVDFAVGADWTPAAGDVKILIDGTAAANVANLPTAIAAGNTALWEFILTAAELTGKQIEVTIADSATKAVEDQSFIVETFGNASAMYQADLAAANLPVNVIQVNGTAQTAGDIPARLPAALTANGNMKSSLVEILTTVLTETAGQLAGGFKKFFNIGAPASTMDALTLVATATNLTNAPTAGDFTATMKASIGTAVAASAVASVTGNVGGNVNGNVVGTVASVVGNVGGNIVGTVASVVGAVGSVTASVTITAASITAIWNEVVDGAFTARQLLRGYASALLGICSGMATGTGVFRDISNTKNRISVTQDANGNRSAFGTLDLS